MMSDTAQVLTLGVPVFVLAGMVKGLIGIGLPTLAIGLLAQFIDARYAIALVVVPMLVANAWQIFRTEAPVSTIRRVSSDYRVLLVSLLVSIGVVSLLAPQVSVATVTLALGCVMTLFAAVNLWRQPPALPDRLDRAAQWLTGMLAGAIGGIAGVWAPPIIIYLAARRVDKDAFVETAGVLLFGSSAVLLAGYLISGLLDVRTAFLSMLFIPPALLGFTIGERWRSRLSGPGFRIAVLGFFLLMGLNLVRRSLWGEG